MTEFFKAIIQAAAGISWSGAIVVSVVTLALAWVVTTWLKSMFGGFGK